MPPAANDPGSAAIAALPDGCSLLPPAATNARRASRAPHLVGRRCASCPRSPARSPRSPWLLGQTPRSGDERMLDAAAQENWAQHGWLWLRGFLGAAEVEELRRSTDEIA